MIRRYTVARLLSAGRVLTTKPVIQPYDGLEKIYRTPCKCIQTDSEFSAWNHPWTRDMLAERMSIVRQRRQQRRKKRLPLPLNNYHLAASAHWQPREKNADTYTVQPETPEEEIVAPLLARTDLIVTRNIEWANIIVGFEQENRYVIMDPRESLSVVGFITESSNFLYRQLLRTRRPFNASIMDAAGNILFTVRRPIWFINSTIYAEVDGEVIGFAKRRWHLWRRIYDIYLGKKQFAVVENPGFWNWTFTLKDENDRVLAEIDRHFRGFGYEMLTDAGQYAMRFGGSAPQHQSNEQIAQPPNLQGISVNPETEAEQFISERPLTLSERIVTLALAISIDNDYFSRHRGMFLPFPFVSDGE